VTIRYETTPTTKNDMGSLATKPATQHELAEATRQPSSGRPQPHSMATTTPVGAARSAAPPAATSIKGLWTTGKGKLLVYGKGKASSLHGKETFRHGKGTLGKWQGQRKVPRQILPVTARQDMLLGRCVRSGGHTACDGKAWCRSLFIPTGGAGGGATAARQSQHALMTSSVVRHYVSQWQRCIVRTIE